MKSCALASQRRFAQQHSATATKKLSWQMDVAAPYWLKLVASKLTQTVAALPDDPSERQRWSRLLYEHHALGKCKDDPTYSFIASRVADVLEASGQQQPTVAVAAAAEGRMARALAEERDKRGLMLTILQSDLIAEQSPEIDAVGPDGTPLCGAAPGSPPRPPCSVDVAIIRHAFYSDAGSFLLVPMTSKLSHITWEQCNMRTSSAHHLERAPPEAISWPGWNLCRFWSPVLPTFIK